MMTADNHGFIKAEKVVRTALGLLEREIVLPGLVWRTAGGAFVGSKNETIPLRLPAFGREGRTRDLQSATSHTPDNLDERAVTVSLDKDVYKATNVTDEQLTLDIESFGEQILTPVVSAVARTVEAEVAALISEATYAEGYELTLDEENPFKTFAAARKALNLANVPAGGRRLIVGADVEELLLTNDQFLKANESGSDAALREARIGRVAGMDVFVTNSIAPDEAYMFHQTAFVLSTQAPAVPAGAPYGAGASHAGLAMRVVRDYDFANIQDRLVANLYMGTNVVTDNGHFDMD